MKGFPYSGADVGRKDRNCMVSACLTTRGAPRCPQVRGTVFPQAATVPFDRPSRVCPPPADVRPPVPMSQAGRPVGPGTGKTAGSMVGGYGHGSGDEGSIG